MTSPFPALETAPEITGPLAFGAPVAVAVPGGKGSDVAAAETLAYLLKVHDLVQSATCPDNHDIYRGGGRIGNRLNIQFPGRPLVR